MKVFEPFKLKNLELKNRMVVSAMVTNYCTPDGMATEKFIAYHEHKAKGGWGLIITEDYAVTKTAGGFQNLPGLWENAQVESHRKLTERVHAAGGIIAAQIYHAGRETSSAVTGEQPVAPSAVREPSMPETPRELSVEEIHTLVEQFGDCAKRAKEAGFDAVEVHGAHGYLVGAFASPFSNKRSDEYGGTIRNRARFGMEIIQNIKKKCGEDYPVIYRISSVEYVPGGLEIEESKVIARLMEKAGADCIHCSQGVYASTHTIIPPSVFPKAGYVEHAAEMKKVVNIPVIAVGRINDVEIAESVLQAGKAEFASFICWQKKMLEKMQVQVLLNTTADVELIQLYAPDTLILATGSHPFLPPIKGADQDFVVTAHEILLGKREAGKNVVVIGGGLVGAETADLLSEQCEQVTIVEMMPQIMRDGEPTPAKYMQERFKAYGVKIHTSAKVMEIGEHMVKAEKDGKEMIIEPADTVVVAAGVRKDQTLTEKVDQFSCKVLKVGDANGVKNGYLGIREGFEAGLYA